MAIYARDKFTCVYCGEQQALLTLDHLQPRELGGNNSARNLITACVHCNSARRDSSMRKWFAMLRVKGVDTSGLSAKIRRQTRKRIDTALGKALLTTKYMARGLAKAA